MKQERTRDAVGSSCGLPASLLPPSLIVKNKTGKVTRGFKRLAVMSHSLLLIGAFEVAVAWLALILWAVNRFLPEPLALTENPPGPLGLPLPLRGVPVLK